VKLTIREMVMAALFAALAMVAAMLVRYAGPIVPFSLVPFVAMLAGGLLGAKAGALSMLVYVLLGLVGLPVFEKPPFGGPAYFFQPTFGYLLGYIAQAYVTGALLPRQGQPGVVRYFMAMAGGLVALYLFGLVYLCAILNFYLGKQLNVLQVIKIGFLPFIGLDLIKAAVAAPCAGMIFRRIRTASGQGIQ